MDNRRWPRCFANRSALSNCRFVRLFGSLGAGGWLVPLPKNRFSGQPLRGRKKGSGGFLFFVSAGGIEKVYHLSLTVSTRPEPSPLEEVKIVSNPTDGETYLWGSSP
jgi:hypothetical protein